MHRNKQTIPTGDYALGIDIGGTNIKFALFSDSIDDAFTASMSFRDVCNRCSDFSNSLFYATADFISTTGISFERVFYVGICVPGRVDYKNGKIRYAYNLGLTDESFTDEVYRYFPGIHGVTTMNDADAATYAEFCLGALRGSLNACLITLGTGVGAGFIINGKLFTGGRGRGTEFGHAIMDRNTSMRCTCGQTGCIEALCSASYIERRALEISGEKLSAKDVFLLQQNNNEWARALVTEYIDNLAGAVVTLVNVFDPEIIALGGGVAQAGDIIIKPLKAAVDSRCFFEDAAEIRIAKLGSYSGAIGAGLYACR